MRGEATMVASAAGEVFTLAAAVLIAVAFALPVLDHAQSTSRWSRWQWRPTQRDAWNPYDCCFWQELPVEEFAM